MTERTLIEADEEHDRYHRQSLISWWDQDVLAAAQVIVVGAGALGNELAKNLALVGIGNVTIVDMDRIENSNLSRCVFFRAEDEGRFKAEVLAERAMELNPEVNVTGIVGDVRFSLGIGDFANADVVLGGLDNREARLYVNQACWKTSTPWIDGAIEGLMGVAQVFIPPDTACYECTMNDRDFELIAMRRTCSLLKRDEMLEGKVPTTATSSSVVAGIQAQEAIKLLHIERLGEPNLAGGGFNFVGLTHDSYVVKYPRREECLAHDTYDIDAARSLSPETTFAEILESVTGELGPNAVVDLEHEVLLTASCGDCSSEHTINRPLDAVTEGEGACPDCEREMRLETTHSVTAGSPIAGLTPSDLGLPTNDVVTARGGDDGMTRIFFMTGEGARA